MRLMFAHLKGKIHSTSGLGPLTVLQPEAAASISVGRRRRKETRQQNLVREKSDFMVVV